MEVNEARKKDKIPTYKSHTSQSNFHRLFLASLLVRFSTLILVPVSFICLSKTRRVKFPYKIVHQNMSKKSQHHLARFMTVIDLTGY